MPYYVYIILCQGDGFYTGYTSNMKTRMRLHRNGKGARYTKMHKPRELVHVEEFSTRTEAMKREKRIKKMNHNQKLVLIKKAGRKRIQRSTARTRRR
jgi:putative endonuclease